jgi:hypothetical protein
MLSLTACASNNIKKPEINAEKIYDAMEILGQDEVYFIYKKDEKGNPVSLEAVEMTQAGALSRFRQKSTIEQFDCIRMVRLQTIGSQVSVCDEGKWFDYGLNGKTNLTTREAKSTGETIWGGAMSAIVSPLSLAVDVLNFDPSLSSTRKLITGGFTDPVQDFEILNKIKPVIDGFVTQVYIAERDRAERSIDAAMSYVTKYRSSKMAMSFTDDIVAKNIQASINEASPYKVYRIAAVLPLSPQNKDHALSYLRGTNTFEGSSYAFDLTSSMDDAKQAQALAQSSGDRQKVEYMTMKMIKSKSGSLNNLFTTTYATALSSSSVDGVRRSGGFFVDNSNWGAADFSTSMRVAAKRDLGVFAYGEYKVTVRSTLTLKKHRYRRSAWLGNADEDFVDTRTVDNVFVLMAPDYTAVQSVQFKNVTLNFQERGSMGGITSETQVGDPVVKSEVIDVSLVN